MQMIKISAGEILACVTLAVLFNRRKILAVFGFFNGNSSSFYIQGPISRFSCWSNTIKGIHSEFYNFRNVFGGTDSKKMTRFFFGQSFVYKLNQFKHSFFGFAHSATEAETVKRHTSNRFKRFFP